MNSALIAFLVAIGGGTWIYTKMMKSSGGLTKNALIVAGIAGFLLFLVLWSALSLFM